MRRDRLGEGTVYVAIQAAQLFAQHRPCDGAQAVAHRKVAADTDDGGQRPLIRKHLFECEYGAVGRQAVIKVERILRLQCVPALKIIRSDYPISEPLPVDFARSCTILYIGRRKNLNVVHYLILLKCKHNIANIRRFLPVLLSYIFNYCSVNFCQDPLPRRADFRLVLF